MSKKVISWMFLENDETYELKPNERIIDTHLASPTSELDDEYNLVLVIEKTEELPK